MDLTDRITALHDGPNRLALPFHGDAPFELHWAFDQDFEAFPELDDDEGVRSDYLLLATAQRSDALLAMVISKAAPHPVFVFFEGLQRVTESLDALVRMLAEPDPSIRREGLRAQIEESARAIDARSYADAVEGLERALGPFTSTQLEPRDPLAPLLARGFTDLGFARHQLGDQAQAALAYERGAALGSVPAGKNRLTMFRDAADWSSARAWAEGLLQRFKNPVDLTEIRGAYAIALAVLGDRQVLEGLTAQHVDYLKWLANTELELATALRDQLVATLQAAEVEVGARALLEVASASLRQVALVSKARSLSERDITSALEAIRKDQESRFKNWVKSKPALAQEPRVLEAIRALEEPAASRFRALLSG